MGVHQSVDELTDHFGCTQTLTRLIIVEQRLNIKCYVAHFKTFPDHFDSHRSPHETLPDVSVCSLVRRLFHTAANFSVSLTKQRAAVSYLDRNVGHTSFWKRSFIREWFTEINWNQQMKRRGEEEEKKHTHTLYLEPECVTVWGCYNTHWWNTSRWQIRNLSVVFNPAIVLLQRYSVIMEPLYIERDLF